MSLTDIASRNRRRIASVSLAHCRKWLRLAQLKLRSCFVAHALASFRLRSSQGSSGGSSPQRRRAKARRADSTVIVTCKRGLPVWLLENSSQGSPRREAQIMRCKTFGPTPRYARTACLFNACGSSWDIKSCSAVSLIFFIARLPTRRFDGPSRKLAEPATMGPAVWNYKCQIAE